jgi:hypothetical protein
VIDGGTLQIRLDIIINRSLQVCRFAGRVPLISFLAVDELLVRVNKLLETLKLGVELVQIDPVGYITRITN